MEEKRFVKYYCVNTKTGKNFCIYKWQIFSILYTKIKEAIAKRQYDKMIKEYY